MTATNPANESTPARTVKTADVAALLRVTPAAVRQLIRRGPDPLPVQERSRGGRQSSTFDLGEVGAWLERQAEARGMARGPEGSDVPPDLAAARTRLATAQAEAVELRNQQRRGDVLPIAVFGHAWDNLAASVRSRFEALALRVKTAQPELSAAALDVIRTEVAAALEDLARLRFDESGDVAATGEPGVAEPPVAAA